MPDYFSCITVNDLEEFAFIGGTKYELTFDVYDSASAAIDLSTSTATWVLSPYGNPQYAALTKTGVLSGSPVNRVIFTVESADTETLSGKYTHQPVIVDFTGDEFRPSQGIVTIIPRNATI